MTKIAIVDYKLGNQTSLKIFCKNLGFNCLITDSHHEIRIADIIILPGVGAFSEAMKNIKKENLDRVIQDENKINKPIIGICLGMQIMGTRSFELGKTEGLKLIPGDIEPLSNHMFNIGWSNIIKTRKASEIYFSNEDAFFFNHSFKFNCNQKYIISETNDKYKIPSIIKNKNIIGIQFHPEKSQNSGKNFFANLIPELHKNV
jgi:glutamine amidotransferase